MLPPLEEGVTLHVAVVFDVEVHVKRIAVSAGNVNLYGVVNHQIHGNLRVHFLGVSAHLHHGVAQRSQIHHGGYTGEVLKDDTGRSEGNLTALAVGRPCGDLANVILGDEEAVVASQGTLQENANGVGQMSGGDAVGVECIQREVIAANAEGLPCVKGVQGRHVLWENPAVYEANPSSLTPVLSPKKDRAARLEFTRIRTKAWFRSRQR